MRIVRASAPGRCGILGNPSDGYGGTVISCSIGQRAFVEVSQDHALHFTMAGNELLITSPADLVLRQDFHDIPRNVITYLGLQNERLHIRGWSDVPYRSGLSGSTAMYAAVFGALLKWTGREMTSHEIAESLHAIERIAMKMQCGYQDMYMSVFGGLNYMDFRGKEIAGKILGTIEPLNVQQLPFIIAHTNVQRTSDSVLQPMRIRWENGDRAVIDGYERVGELARLAKSFFLNADWTGFGELMNENHAIVSGLGASGHTNDRLINTAREAGAEGAKLAGAGGGGTIVALATNPAPVIAALRAAGVSEFYSLEPGPGLLTDEPLLDYS